MSNLRFVIGYKKDKVFPVLRSMTIHSASLCGKSITAEFIAESVDVADIIILAYESATNSFDPLPTRRNRQQAIDVKGIALLRSFKHYFYLDLMCSKGAGKAILNQIVMLAEKEGRKTIRLASTPFAMPYWLNQGFRNMKGSESKCMMDSNLNRYLKSILPLKFSTWQEAVENKYLTKYLTALTTMGFTKKRGCKQEECNLDGYTMTLCVDQYLNAQNPSKTQAQPQAQSKPTVKKCRSRTKSKPKKRNSRARPKTRSRSKSIAKNKSKSKGVSKITKARRVTRSQTQPRRSKRLRQRPNRLLF